MTAVASLARRELSPVPSPFPQRSGTSCTSRLWRWQRWCCSQGISASSRARYFARPFDGANRATIPRRSIAPPVRHDGNRVRPARCADKAAGGLDRREQSCAWQPQGGERDTCRPAAIGPVAGYSHLAYAHGLKISDCRLHVRPHPSRRGSRHAPRLPRLNRITATVAAMTYDTTRNSIFLTLGEAASQAGLSKSTVSRAIRDGKLSATRNVSTIMRQPDW